MQIASHLGQSRHGVYYFRWPLPRRLHPSGRASQIRVSLRTRVPRQAQSMSRQLALAGQSAIRTAFRADMTYEEMRQHVQEHFASSLATHQSAILEDGQVTDERLDALTASQGLAEAGLDEWLGSS